MAADEADLETISALMQDAAVKSSDVAYDAKARRLVILANRYRWETRHPSRARSALRIDSLTALKRRGWPPADTVLDLLAVRWAGGGIEIDFAGGAALRADAECIDVELHDLSGPWGTKRTPRHTP
nr:DUF2948 family protein [Sphingosinicella soli]